MEIYYVYPSGVVRSWICSSVIPPPRDADVFAQEKAGPSYCNIEQDG